MSKKSSQSAGKNKYVRKGKNAQPKEKPFSTPGELQPHNAKKEALGPNTNR